MSKPEFYSNEKILSKLDLNGEIPWIYLVEGNRTAGKTFAFKKTTIDDWFTNKHKFLILVRKADEMEGIEDSFFTDIRDNPYDRTYANLTWDTSNELRGRIRRIFLNEACEAKNPDECCGFITCITASDKIKKHSNIFAQVYNCLFDEFQSEVEDYVDKELTKFLSIATSISRGQGKQVRRTRWFLISNSTSLFNPYYIGLGVYKRLKSDTKFLRGDGWVLERTLNTSAQNAIMTSGIARAFKDADYFKYASGNDMLLDTNSFIEKRPKDNMRYFATIISEKKYYGMWFDPSDGIYYISKSCNRNFRMKFAASLEDHSSDTLLFSAYRDLASQWCLLFDQGKWRFEDGECKNATFKLFASRKF